MGGMKKEPANPSPDNIIDLCSSSDEEEDRKLPAKRLLEEAEIKDSKKSKTVDSDDDDEVQIVDAPATIEPVISPEKVNDEVQVVGTKNHVDLPHMRQHCTTKPFGNGANVQFCSNCYCYVCDIKAEECTTWVIHCNATDTGPSAFTWKRMRAEKKSGRAPQHALPSLPSYLQQQHDPTPPDPSIPAGAFETEHFNQPPPQGFHFEYECDFEPDYDYWFGDYDHECRCCYCYVCHQPCYACTDKWQHNNASSHLLKWKQARYHSIKDRVFGEPPFAPGHLNADVDPQLIKCSICEWYSPWKDPLCHSCGMFLPEKTVNGRSSWENLQQTTPPTANQLNGHTALGQRKLTFTIDTHDPREITTYSARWQENTHWQFDAKAARQMYFDRLIGKRPSATRLLNLASVWASESREQLEKNTSYCPGVYSPSDRYGIVFEKENEFSLLKALALVSAYHNFGLRVNCSVEWNAQTELGTATVELHVKAGKTVNQNALEGLLYCWYGGNPLSLPVQVFSNCRRKYESGTPYADRLPAPFRNKQKEAKEAADALISKTVAEQNKAHESLSSQMSLHSSSGEKKLGGCCFAKQNEFSSFIREILLSDPLNAAGRRRLLDYQVGVRSWHRAADRGRDFSRLDKIPDDCAEWTQVVYHPLDFALASVIDFGSPPLIGSITEFMQHVENLGHESAPEFEGLKVELLPFQRQSLQWALEREKTPGGLQNYLWTKLPTYHGSEQEIYYNPYMGSIRVGKPNLVRGGIIAEEMGLGKTVISLSIILCNPAPAVPPSGSPVTSILGNAETTPTASDWDLDLYERESKNQPKRGSILSRGTLVVCNVSLVGQWIDEAKSKLSDPGLVYSYHGAGRNRDPGVLAQNSIVVTTYETLASDFKYHRKKNDDDSSYCPPCEQIRWWRVICDECHILRNANNNRSRAVMNLSADNKWLVSGTPMNTMKDILNQLDFLGLKEEKKACIMPPRNSGHRGRKRLNEWESIENGAANRIFRFLRIIMIRHSQQQKYVGTDTTLMSLPKKTEKDVLVEFNQSDLAEYRKMEAECKERYQLTKTKYGSELHRHFFLLSQMLLPIRVACSGGRPPLREDESDESCHDDDSSMVGDTGKKKKSEFKFSEYCFTSKLNRLVDELVRVREEDNIAKSLVFSQFKSTLEWLKVELPKRGFQYRTLSGDMPLSKRAKALREFQNDPPTTIFLLTMRSGAVGINLTQANRIFILEPHFNPAIEAQAIGRVHRLGQTRPVEITRFIMKDSVESRMLKMLDKKYGGHRDEDGKPAPSSDSNVATSVAIAPEPSSTDAEGLAEQVPSAELPTDSAATEEMPPDELDQKPAADPNKPESLNSVLVGSLRSDKAIIAAEEFDLLFGVNAEDP